MDGFCLGFGITSGRILFRMRFYGWADFVKDAVLRVGGFYLGCRITSGRILLSIRYYEWADFV